MSNVSTRRSSLANVDPSPSNHSSTPVLQDVVPENKTHFADQPPTPNRSDTNDNPWQICLKYSKKMAEGEVAIWRRQVKQFLVFVSLFSGVASQFAIESYHNVKQDPTQMTVQLLKDILVLQMNATSPQSNLPINLNPVTPIPAAAKRINTYHFLSLVLSLSAVLLAFLCLQWLDQYELEPSGVPGSERECLGVRYMRAEGMKKWHVFRVLAILPLIFFFAIFLFFAGLLELLWGVNQTAAIATSAVVGIVITFVLFTTILPAVQTCWIYLFPKIKFAQCPYKSPQAWIFYQLVALPLRILATARSTLWGQSSFAGIRELELQNWSGYDRLVYSSHTGAPDAISNVAFGLHWVGRQFLAVPEFAAALYSCIQDPALHASLRDVLKAQGDVRRVNALETAWMLPPSQLNLGATGAGFEEQKRAHVCDITVYQTLLHLTEKMERGSFSSTLLKERLDLFLKINKIHSYRDIDYPLDSMSEGIEALPDDTRRGLLQSILTLMRTNIGVNETHLRGVTQILSLEHQMPDHDVHQFDDALDALKAWIRCQGWDDDDAEVRKTMGPQTQLQTLAIQLERHIHLLRRIVKRG